MDSNTLMQIQQFVFNHYEENCYVLYDETSRLCTIVDPGANATHEDTQLTQFIEENRLTPFLVLLTHAHVDHLAGLQPLCQRYKLPVTMHPEGAKLLRQAGAYASVMGFDVDDLDNVETHFIDHGTILKMGNSSIECRYVPGHCPGSLCFVLHKERKVLTGDALFHLSIGRADLPGGDPLLLIDKIREELLTLPDDYEVLPGHALRSSIGKERLHNPYLRG